jgi:hypothetical protein
MVDDDKQDDSAADPWAGIEASSTPDLSEGLGFSFDEPAEPKADAEADAFAGLGLEAAAEQPAADSLPASDDDVGDWLQEDAAAPVAPLSVFSPDEPAMSDDDVAALLGGESPAAETGEPAIDDMFGQPVVEEPSGDEAAAESPFAAGESPAVDAEPALAGSEGEEGNFPWGGMGDQSTADGEFDMGFSVGEPQTAAEEDAPVAFATDDGSPAEGDLFPAGMGDAVAAGALAAGAAAVSKAKPVGKKPAAKPAAKPAKKSGLGQLVGIVLGGVMAIPITLAILIWGLQKDPFKVAKMVPDEYKFLLPQKLQGKKQVAVRGPDLAQAASLDALPAAEPAAAGDAGAAGEGTPGGDAAAAPADGGEKPMKQPGLDDLANSIALDPAAAETPKPVAEPAPAPPAAPEPEPLDLSGLDTAIAEATTAMEAVPPVEDGDKKARMRALAAWYKSLAKVAEELAMLERVAADSGRPLEAAPEQFVTLQAALVAQPGMLEELSTWGRNWIGFSKRGSAGIVLPVTFDSATRLGPFWSAKVLIDKGEGDMEELAIVSRTEPAALTGDRVIVTGLLLDGDVIWATDCRKPSTEKPAASALDDESF